MKLAARKYLPRPRAAKPAREIPQPKHEFENIINRRSIDGGKQYLVVWKGTPDPKTKKPRFSATWELGAELKKDGGGDLLKLVDDWVDNVMRRIPFESYLKSSALAIGIMGTSIENDCTFVAVKAAFEALGLFGTATRVRFDDYLSILAVDVSGGLEWPKLAGFLKYLHSEVPACALDESRSKNLFKGDGSGHAAILRLLLGDGVYLMGTSNGRRVGHCAALEEKWGTYWVWYEGSWIPLLDADFINYFHFVRDLVHRG